MPIMPTCRSSASRPSATCVRSQEERALEPTDAKRIADGGNYYSLDYKLDFDASGFAKVFSMPSANPERTAPACWARWSI